MAFETKLQKVLVGTALVLQFLEVVNDMGFSRRKLYHMGAGRNQKKKMVRHSKRT